MAALSWAERARGPVTSSTATSAFTHTELVTKSPKHPEDSQANLNIPPFSMNGSEEPVISDEETGWAVVGASMPKKASAASPRNGRRAEESASPSASRDLSLSTASPSAIGTPASMLAPPAGASGASSPSSALTGKSLTEPLTKVLPPLLDDVSAWPAPSEEAQKPVKPQHSPLSGAAAPSNGTSGVPAAPSGKKKNKWISIPAEITHNAPLPTNYPASARAGKAAKREKGTKLSGAGLDKERDPEKHLHPFAGASSEKGKGKVAEAQSVDPVTPPNVTAPSVRSQVASHTSVEPPAANGPVLVSSECSSQPMVPAPTALSGTQAPEESCPPASDGSFVLPHRSQSHGTPAQQKEEIARQLVGESRPPFHGGNTGHQVYVPQGPSWGGPPDTGSGGYGGPGGPTGWIPRISATIQPPPVHLSAGPRPAPPVYSSHRYQPNQPSDAYSRRSRQHLPPVPPTATPASIYSPVTSIPANHVNAPQGNVLVDDPLVVSDGSQPVVSSGWRDTTAALVWGDSGLGDNWTDGQSESGSVGPDLLRSPDRRHRGVNRTAGGVQNGGGNTVDRGSPRFTNGERRLHPDARGDVYAGFQSWRETQQRGHGASREYHPAAGREYTGGSRDHGSREYGGGREHGGREWSVRGGRGGWRGDRGRRGAYHYNERGSRGGGSMGGYGHHQQLSRSPAQHDYGTAMNPMEPSAFGYPATSPNSPYAGNYPAAYPQDPYYQTGAYGAPPYPYYSQHYVMPPPLPVAHPAPHQPLPASAAGLPGPPAPPLGYEGRPAPSAPHAYQLDPTRYYVLGQVEWWLTSPENLIKDIFLRSKMDEEGWVNIDTLAGFNRLRSLTTDLALIRDVLPLSPLLEVDLHRGLVRNRHEWRRWVQPKGKVYAGGIPGTSPQTATPGAIVQPIPSSQPDKSAILAGEHSVASGLVIGPITISAGQSQIDQVNHLSPSPSLTKSVIGSGSERGPTHSESSNSSDPGEGESRSATSPGRTTPGSVDPNRQGGEMVDSLKLTLEPMVRVIQTGGQPALAIGFDPARRVRGQRISSVAGKKTLALADSR